MSKATQTQRVLDYIERFGSITQQEADTIAVKRLASRISDLKKQGYPIISKRETSKNKYGETCRYSRYYLISEEGEHRAN